MNRMPPTPSPERVVLAGFEVDLARAELRTAQGAYVDLRPRSFAVLHLLARNLGRVVSKQEIIGAVWNDAAVTDDSLTQCVADIRRAIGDRDHRVLRTVPRRGYMLLGVPPGPPGAPEGPGMPALPARRPPETRYARSGSYHIAYQVTGEGPVDLVFVQGYVTHLEIEWEDPRPAGFYDELSSFCRLIRFDKRGTGLSDRVSGLPTLEERMDDVRAVMDAVGSERAVLLGSSEGGPMSVLFCATYPRRVQSLILYGAMARNAWAPDHPWGRTVEQLANGIRTTEEKWGSGHSVDLFAPSAAAEPAYRAWRARLDRAAASPGAAITLARMNFEIDVRHVLPSVAVPALVVHRTGDIAVSVEHSRDMARRIPDARYVELPGHDHAPWVGDTRAVCDAFRAFIADPGSTPESDRVLVTVLVARLAWRGARPDADGRAALRRQIALHGGREIEEADGRCIVAFEGPARAVRCGRAIVDALKALGTDACVGVHTGECEIRGGRIQGMAIQIGAHVAEAASRGDLLVSSTVRDLVAGSGLRFDPRHERAFPGIPGRWTLLAAL